MSSSDPRGSDLDWNAAAEGLDNEYDTYWVRSQAIASALQFETPPSHAPFNPESMGVHPSNLAQQPGETSQIGTPPNHAVSNHGSMHVQPPQLAQQPGTSQPSNITNAADAAKREKIRESKTKSREKKETERKENEKRLAEVTKENGVLLEAIARLEREAVEAKIKQKNDEQEVSRLNKKLKGQTTKKRKLRARKLTRSVKRIIADILVNINEGQERIRAGQKEVREKFEEISKDTAKLKEEININYKQSADQVRLDLMFQIVKARSENDAPKDAAPTQILRELINGEAEPD